MKMKIARNKLLEGIRTVQNIVSSKAASPVLQNVCITKKDGKLEMKTTDLEMSIVWNVECDDEGEFSTTIPVKLFANSIQKAVEGDIEIETDENDVSRIIAGSAKFKIAGIPASQFPPLPENTGSYTYIVGQNTLRDMFRKTVYAAAQDDTRRNLKSVLMRFRDGKITMVATDGRRLAMIEKEAEFPESEAVDIVLPARTVQELLRVLPADDNEIGIKFENSQVSFDNGSMKIYSKLVVDPYPNFMQVIPQDRGEEIVIERQLLIDAIERASVLTLDEMHSVKLTFEGNRVLIASAATDKGEAKDEVPIKYAGEPIEIVFNPTFLTDPLRAIEDDEVSLFVKSGFLPAVIKSQDAFLYVLMPLRVS